MSIYGEHKSQSSMKIGGPGVAGGSCFFWCGVFLPSNERVDSLLMELLAQAHEPKAKVREVREEKGFFGESVWKHY